MAPSVAYEAALAIINANKWKIVSQKPNEHIQAISATRLGFQDDVVVVFEAQASGTLVQMRSKSRIGTSDLRKNVTRIRGFLANLARKASK